MTYLGSDAFERITLIPYGRNNTCYIDVIRADLYTQLGKTIYGNVHQFVYNYAAVTGLLKSTQQTIVTRIYKIDFE